MTKIFMFLDREYHTMPRGERVELIAMNVREDDFYVLRPSYVDGVMNARVGLLIRRQSQYDYVSENYTTDDDRITLRFDRYMFKNEVEVVSDD